MKSEEQKITSVEIPQLVPLAAARAAEGWRLVQICCTRLADRLEVTYSFDRNHVFECLRVWLPKESPALPSISSAFTCSFTYENELHDLFGVAFSGLNVDYGGNFYRTAVRTPFMVEKKPAAAAAAPKPAPAG